MLEYGLGVGKQCKGLASYYMVLILIVLEYGLGVEKQVEPSDKGEIVLILIVLEYGLGEVRVYIAEWLTPSLNPYCAGIWSRSYS